MRRLAPLALVFALAAASPSGKQDDVLMGSVVRSDNWKMDRVRNVEVFEGNVSFRNAFYTMKADHAVYDKTARLWTITGDVYTERRLADGSRLEINCDLGRYRMDDETAFLESAAWPVKMKYYGADGRLLTGLCARARAANKEGRMYFSDNFSLFSEDLRIFSSSATYDDAEKTFLIYGSTPIALGRNREYDFALNGQEMRFYRDSGDIRVDKQVTGWVKDEPAKEKDETGSKAP